MYLSDDVFREVVRATPLVSIDLVVDNREGEFLLGRRLHRPAQGSWFVPGGRIRKNERLDDAFLRLTEVELGQAIGRSSARFLGVYEHFYQDSVFGDGPQAISTHYIALAYRLSASDFSPDRLPSRQHDSWRWWSSAEAVQEPLVHAMTLAYIHDASR